MKLIIHIINFSGLLLFIKVVVLFANLSLCCSLAQSICLFAAWVTCHDVAQKRSAVRVHYTERAFYTHCQSS
jgi:hypothetical protein